jgi:hypothetical protein
VLTFQAQVEVCVKIPGSGGVDETQLETVETPAAPEDEPAPAALVMVEADGADVCAADGTCW